MKILGSESTEDPGEYDSLGDQMWDWAYDAVGKHVSYNLFKQVEMDLWDVVTDGTEPGFQGEIEEVIREES